MLKKSRIILLTALMVVVLMAPAAEAAVHTIRRGDTLWQISQFYKTTVAEIAQANTLRNVHFIYVGQRLTVPTGEAATNYTVCPGDTLWFIAQRHKVTVPELLAVNHIPQPNHIEAGQRIIIPTGAAVPVASRGSGSYSAAELDLLARLVRAEAGGESFKGQVAVAASVLNRVRSSIYPSTVTGVINQVVGGYYQYSPVLDGSIKQPANDSARRAVQEAIAGVDPSLGALGFYNPRKTSNQWVRSQPVTITIGNHVFFR